MVENTKKMHYAWLIMIGCCFLAAGTLALTVSVAGVYILPASQAMGVGPGDFAMWLTVSGFASVVALPIYGQLMPRFTKLVTTTAASLMIVGVLLLALSVSAKMYPTVIVGGILIGLGIPGAFTLTIPTLMGNWFSKKQRGKFLGIATAFSGAGVFVWAPTFTLLLQNLGVMTALIINAILMAVLVLPWTLFVFRFKPEEKGLTPWGTEKEGAADEEANKALQYGLSASKAFGTVAFWAVFVIVALTGLNMGYNGMQPAIATDFLAGSLTPEAAGMLGATMISVAAVGNLTGKIIYGWLADRIGIKVTTIIFVVALALCFVIWLVFPVVAMMYVGAYLLGTHNGLISVGYPLIVRSIFGEKDFSKIYSRLSMISALLGGSAASIIGYTYQFTGSYQGAVTCGIALAAIIGIFAIIAMSFIGKVKWDSPAPKKDAT